MARCLISSQRVKNVISETPCTEEGKKTALSILGFFSFFDGKFISPFVFWLGILALKLAERLVEKEQEEGIRMIIQKIKNLRGDNEVIFGV